MEPQMMFLIHFISVYDMSVKGGYKEDIIYGNAMNFCFIFF